MTAAVACSWSKAADAKPAWLLGTLLIYCHRVWNHAGIRVYELAPGHSLQAASTHRSPASRSRAPLHYSTLPMLAPNTALTRHGVVQPQPEPVGVQLQPPAHAQSHRAPQDAPCVPLDSSCGCSIRLLSIILSFKDVMWWCCTSVVVVLLLVLLR